MTETRHNLGVLPQLFRLLTPSGRQERLQAQQKAEHLKEQLAAADFIAALKPYEELIAQLELQQSVDLRVVEKNPLDSSKILMKIFATQTTEGLVVTLDERVDTTIFRTERNLFDQTCLWTDFVSPYHVCSLPMRSQETVRVLIGETGQITRLEEGQETTTQVVSDPKKQTEALQKLTSILNEPSALVK